MSLAFSNTKILALYQFKKILSPSILQQRLLAECLEQGVKGTLLIAHEGINGTLAGSASAIDYLHHWLVQKAGFDNLMLRISWAQRPPFLRLKVKLKNEIVTMGKTQVDPLVCVGTYVSPQDWNTLIQRPDVVLIDTRNHYEYQLGTFKGAINPHTAHFRQFPAYLEQWNQDHPTTALALFCTGGIRCEKATAYAKQLGIAEVYHLQGGILHYLETIPAAESLWQGECFVFDDRMVVRQGLVPGCTDRKFSN